MILFNIIYYLYTVFVLDIVAVGVMYITETMLQNHACTHAHTHTHTHAHTQESHFNNSGCSRIVLKFYKLFPGSDTNKSQSS